MRRDQAALAFIFSFALICIYLWSSADRIEALGKRMFNHKSALVKKGINGTAQTNLSKQQNEPTEAQKILCWVMTIDNQVNREKSKAVVETWGKRCDKLLLVQNGTKLELIESANKTESVLKIPIEHESRNGLWFKVQQTFSFIQKHFSHDFDWFLKTDDDTYVVVENLRHFLSEHSPDEPVYYGYRFKPYVKQGYMSGGAGYVLSRQALRLLVEEGINMQLEACHLNSSVEDVEIGSCLQAVKVKAGDSRDSQGRPRFLPLSPEWMLTNEVKKEFWFFWYWFYGPPGSRKDCCSESAISFHYITPQFMRLIDWLLYDLRRPN